MEMKIHNQETLLHLNDVDATMEAHEVLEAMEKAVGSPKGESITVKSLRPNGSGGQLAMVAIQNREAAENSENKTREARTLMNGPPHWT
ncbi:hypothetical protein JTB14_000544 [Gonioctena quinquepunctata]|nr:hypothetical protein JTB14_000544 [Gonioctena quinquepunctata]